jgi:AcrR family transcriptional regulator
MKTTKPQQEQTRRHIVRAAVDLVEKQGYEETTMKEIARQAGIGDATIYKYFPSKPKLLLGYFEITFADALKQVAETTEVEQFSLHERLLLLVDIILENMLADREFVAIARAMAASSPLLMMRDEMPGQRPLKAHVVALLDAAEESGEIAPCDFKNVIGGFFADYVFAVMLYWLRDETEDFSDTTQLVDLTLGVLVLALKSGVVNKLTELASFMLRSQMSRMLQNGSGLLDLLKSARRTLGA